MANRPAENFSENQKHFSGKHLLYGFKTKALDLPNGIAVLQAQYFQGQF